MLIATHKAVSMTAFNFNQLSNKIEILNQIIEDNQTLKHNDLEKILLQFIQRMYDVSDSINKIIDIHFDTVIGLWRTLYEDAVVFRIMTQPFILDSDLQSFKLLLERYQDYGVILSNKTFKDSNYYQVNQVYDKYRELAKTKPELQLQYDNDWANPIFSKIELSAMMNKYHPSFRDLVYKTKLVNNNYYGMLDVYKLSSDVIHVTPITNDVIQYLSSADILQDTKIIIDEFLKDFLNYVIKFADTVNLTEHPLIQNAVKLKQIIN